jgi:uncharacterized protein (DUF488 family)
MVWRTGLLSIGHSSLALPRFLELLRANGVETVIDVRSDPYSHYAPHFTSGSLRVALSMEGVGYLYAGHELGGRPKDERYYDVSGRVDYRLLAGSPAFSEGLARVEVEAARRQAALMCAEEAPWECHRRQLVGRALGERGWLVHHIRADGRLQSDEEAGLEERGGQPRIVQTSFLEEDGEPWKSPRSVARRRR